MIPAVKKNYETGSARSDVSPWYAQLRRQDRRTGSSQEQQQFRIARKLAIRRHVALAGLRNVTEPEEGAQSAARTANAADAMVPGSSFENAC